MLHLSPRCLAHALRLLRRDGASGDDFSLDEFNIDLDDADVDCRVSGAGDRGTEHDKETPRSRRPAKDKATAKTSAPAPPPARTGTRKRTNANNDAATAAPAAADALPSFSSGSEGREEGRGDKPPPGTAPPRGLPKVKKSPPPARIPVPTVGSSEALSPKSSSLNHGPQTIISKP